MPSEPKITIKLDRAKVLEWLVGGARVMVMVVILPGLGWMANVVKNQGAQAADIANVKLVEESHYEALNGRLDYIGQGVDDVKAQNKDIYQKLYDLRGHVK